MVKYRWGFLNSDGEWNRGDGNPMRMNSEKDFEKWLIEILCPWIRQNAKLNDAIFIYYKEEE